MKPLKYEGYCYDTPTELVKETFGNTNFYEQQAKSILNKGTGFIGAYDFTKLNPTSSNIPQDFFDLIIVSHCFSTETKNNQEITRIYKQIFPETLTVNGLILLIIQDKKFWKICNYHPVEDQEFEQYLSEFDLELVWYKYLTSTGRRVSSQSQDFNRFAQENLCQQKYVNSLLDKYFGLKYKPHYTLDDYIVLAKIPQQK